MTAWDELKQHMDFGSGHAMSPAHMRAWIDTACELFEKATHPDCPRCIMGVETARVVFTEVGPRHLSWTADLPQPVTHGDLVKQIRKHKALGSRDIEFADNGAIYVGLFRRVGNWSIV